MVDVIQADRDRRNAIYKELTGFAVIEPVASQNDWMDKYLAAHRIAAEKAVLANGVNCSSCEVRLPKDYEKPCPDCGALDIDTTALADAIGADHGQ